MKAKEYAEMFRKRVQEGKDPNETLVFIALEFFKEEKQILESRHVKNDFGYISVHNEQVQKWKAFARLIPGIEENGYEKVIRIAFPDLAKKIEAFKIQESFQRARRQRL